MTVAAPWLDDARVLAAIANLARSAVELPLDQARSCVAEVANLLELYVRIQGRSKPPNGSPIGHLARYEAVLPLAHLVDWGSRLGWHYAERLLRTSRADEGEALLAELASDPAVGPDVTAWLAHRTERPEMLHDLCYD